MPHRLFIGIRPPEVVRDSLIDLMEGVDNARWQDDDQLHLTLRFIGNMDPHSADDLADLLGGIKVPSFELRISGTGTFAKKGRVHTLWAGIEPKAELLALQSRIERVCIAAGIEPEHRKYHPHITLARLNRSTGPLEPFLSRTAGFAPAPFRVDSFILYESILRPEGSNYDPVIRYVLGPTS